MTREARALLAALCVAAIVTAGLTAWRLIDSPLRYDEADFGAQAEGILTYGVPKIESNGSYRYGMWHPPLYLYSLAAGAGVFGPSNWAFRVVGIAWFGATAFLMWRVAGPLALWLVLLSPLVAQGILYIDIDNTSLAFALLVFGVLVCRSPDIGNRRTAFGLAAVFLFALWSKLTTPYIMLIACAVFYASRREWRAVAMTVGIAAAATAAFLATYFLYCRLTGYPASFMFDTTYVGKSDAYISGGRSPVRSAHAIWWNVIWFSPPLSLLFGLVTFDRLRAFSRTWRPVANDFWLIFCWACFGAYAVWAGVMGKYTFPAALAAGVALALWIPCAISDVRSKRPAVLWASIAALVLVYVFAAPPLQVKPPLSDSPMTLASGLTDPRAVALLGVFTGFAAFAAAAVYAMSGPLLGRVAFALLVCLAVSSTVEAVQVMSSADDRSPYRPFRECCFGPAVDALNRTLAPSDTIIGPKDIGYYFHGQSYALDGARYTSQGMTGAVDLVRHAGIRYAVDSTANPVQDSAEIFRQAGLVPWQRIGDFVIYGPAR